jgi:hypothetical protein
MRQRYGRLPWARYPEVASNEELMAGAIAQMLLALLIRLGLQRKGKIAIPDGQRPTRQLYNILGGRSLSDARFIEAGLERLVAAGLVKITGDAIVLERWDSIYRPRRRGGDMDISWVKLVGGTKGSYALLPPFTQGFGHVLLRLAEEDGGIWKDPAVLVRQLGWGLPRDRHFLGRGLVKQWLDELLADEYLVADPDDQRRLLIKNFTSLQFASNDATEARPERDGSATAVPWECDGDATGMRWERDGAPPKPSESPNFVHQERTNERTNDPPKAPQRGAGGGDWGGRQAVARAAKAEVRPLRRRRRHSGGVEYSAAFRARWNEWAQRAANCGQHPGRQDRAWEQWAAGAASLPGGEAELDQLIGTHLSWALKLSGGRLVGVPHHFANYLEGRTWQTDVRPTNPDAFAPPALTVHASRDAKAAAEAEANQLRSNEALRLQLAAERARPKVDPYERLMAKARDQFAFEEDPACGGFGYQPVKGDARATAVWCAAGREALTRFRAAHPEATERDLPRLMRELLAHHPEIAADFPQLAEGVGTAAAVVYQSATMDQLSDMARALLARCGPVDQRIRLLEERFRPHLVPPAAKPGKERTG